MDDAQTLSRLNRMLPLASRQGALTPAIHEFHRVILQTLAELGRPPTRGELAVVPTIADVDGALATLRDNDLVILGAKGEVVGAYPLTLEETPHRVILHGHEICATCALDALAVSPMFRTPVTIYSRCQHTRRPINLHQDGESLQAHAPCPNVQVGIQWEEPHSCAAHTLCPNIVFFCSREDALEWQHADHAGKTVLALNPAASIARRYFLPLMAVVHGEHT
ncbi:MAG: organomercurial lyase [Betaproteobacteria bacterium]|nr:organomercurial lyase [Betaproteobacteria bacterium]